MILGCVDSQAGKSICAVLYKHRERGKPVSPQLYFLLRVNE